MYTREDYLLYGTIMFWKGAALGAVGLLIFEFIIAPYMFGFFLGLND